MTTEPVTIKLDPDSELARAIEADETPVLLDVRGGVYRVRRDDEHPWANYDPTKVRAGLRRSAGMISPEEAARRKELVYRGREEGTRPLARP